MTINLPQSINIVFFFFFKLKYLQIAGHNLKDSATGSNENPQLELPRAWELTCSRCALSPYEEESSQDFFSHGNKTVNSRDEADSS